MLPFDWRRLRLGGSQCECGTLLLADSVSGCLTVSESARQSKNIRGNGIDLVARKNPANLGDIFKIIKQII